MWPRSPHCTALHWAANVQYYADVVEVLLAAGADASALDSERKTAWDLAGEEVPAVLPPPAPQ